MFSAYSSYIACALACVPALVTWWQYRELSRCGEPAVLTERVARVRSHVAAASGIATTLILIAVSETAVWAIPLLLVALACASHGPRKALFGETWSLGRYIEWRTRVVVATLGFWILLAFTPAIVAATPRPAQWPAAAALLAVLLAWHHFYARILLVALNATPLTRPDLEPFFASVFHGTTAVVPTVWRAGAEGGVFANALALPDRVRGRVLFFDTLLERLTPSEIGAILAHEVAHLEHFDARRLRRAHLAAAGAVALIVCGSAALAVTVPARAWIGSTFAPVIVFMGLVLRARRMQAEETNSDRRAVALCGDPDALISGLTHLHAIHHVPRRVSTETEQHATHPSLARRIRAIREGGAERVVQPLPAPAVLLSSEPGRLAILEPDRLTLVWADPEATGLLGDPIGVAKRIEATAYDQLTELRLSTAAEGRVTLTARSLDGRRWAVPLQPGEAARAQEALNVVDQLLAPPKPANHGASRRAVALITLLFTGALQALSPILVPALLALRRPARPLLLALAAALVTTAFITGADSGLNAVRVLVLGLLAAAAVWQSCRVMQNEGGASPADENALRIESAALAIPVVLGAAWVLASSHDLFGLHAAARDTAWPTASLMALAVYLGLAPQQTQRRIAIGLGALTVAALFAGSSAFLTRVVRDPLVADARDLAEQSVVLTAIAQTTVDGAFDQVRLAPDGRSFLLSEEPDEHDEPAPRRHVIGTFDGWTRTIEADDAVLAGQDRVLLLDRNNGHTQLRTERLRSTAGPAWTLNVPGVEAFSLAAMPDGRWQLMNRERNAFMRIDGRVGTKATSRIKWDVEAGSAEYVSLHGVGAGHVGLGLAVQWSEPSLPSWLPGLEWHRQTTLLRVEGGETNRLATSRLNVACADPAITVATYLCVAFDGRVSRFWRYHPDSARLEPVGRARGWFFLDSQETSTTLTGMREGSVVFADFDAARITAFRLLNSPGFVAHDFSEDFLIASSTVGDQTSVALYRLSDAPTPSAGQVHVRR